MAAARVGVLLNHSDLSQAARRLMYESADTADRSENADIIDGQAGRVVALLALARLLADSDLVALAVRSADSLMRLAVRRRHGGCRGRCRARPDGVSI